MASSELIEWEELVSNEKQYRLEASNFRSINPIFEKDFEAYFENALRKNEAVSTTSSTAAGKMITSCSADLKPNHWIPVQNTL